MGQVFLRDTETNLAADGFETETVLLFRSAIHISIATARSGNTRK